MELYIKPNNGDLAAPRLYQYDTNTQVCLTGFGMAAYATMGYDTPRFEFYSPDGAYTNISALYNAQARYWYAAIPDVFAEQCGVLKVFVVLPAAQGATAQKFKTIYAMQVPIVGKKRPTPHTVFDNATHE